MADALVREINRLGYQPVFLPRTGVKPPELYNYEPHNRRLVRRGELIRYLPATTKWRFRSGQLAAINYQYTSHKRTEAAAAFLKRALECIGIDGAPKVNLGFTSAREFSFSFTDVTFESVDPADLEAALQNLSTTGIPDRYVVAGQLHVAYEYAYAGELQMTRGDNLDFSDNISAEIGAYVDLGTQGSVSVTSKSTISFKNTQGRRAAFAYKAGRLERAGTGWEFFPEVVTGSALVEDHQPYIPQPGIVPDLLDSAE